VPAEATEPTPTVVSQLPLDPTPTPVPVPSDAWLQPEAAKRTAARHNGYGPAGPFTSRLLESPYAIRDQYHLLTAEIGDFNHDTYGFLPWLIDNFEHLGSQEHRRHMKAQVEVTFTKPDSQIAQAMAEIASGVDPYRGVDLGGATAYWDYLIWPSRVLIGHPIQLSVWPSEFERLAEDWYLDHVRFGDTTPFPSYLVEATEFFAGH
jgi:hypothetical protein